MLELCMNGSYDTCSFMGTWVCLIEQLSIELFDMYPNVEKEFLSW